MKSWSIGRAAWRGWQAKSEKISETTSPKSENTACDVARFGICFLSPFIHRLLSKCGSRVPASQLIPPCLKSARVSWRRCRAGDNSLSSERIQNSIKRGKLAVLHLYIQCFCRPPRYTSRGGRNRGPGRGDAELKRFKHVPG